MASFLDTLFVNDVKSTNSHINARNQQITLSLSSLGNISSLGQKVIAFKKQSNQKAKFSVVSFDVSDNLIVLNSEDDNVSFTFMSHLTYIKVVPNQISDGDLSSLVIDNTTGEINLSTFKTFVIPHPIQNDKFLVHACLEGPEVGVYYRGSDQINDGENFKIIQLPNYVNHFGFDFTIHLTQKIDFDSEKVQFNNLIASNVKDGQFKVFGNSCEFYWLIIGKRSEIIVEPNKNNVQVNGNGPYLWI
jgi:hypothetical protein